MHIRTEVGFAKYLIDVKSWGKGLPIYGDA